MLFMLLSGNVDQKTVLFSLIIGNNIAIKLHISTNDHNNYDYVSAIVHSMIIL